MAIAVSGAASPCYLSGAGFPRTEDCRFGVDRESSWRDWRLRVLI
jgi:hypothetical protein